MIFDHWTYNQFYMERLSWTSQQNVPNSIHFTTEEIQWAIEQTEYKYFGSYEFSDQQEMAMEILVWVANSHIKLKAKIEESVSAYERLGEVSVLEGNPLIYAQTLLELGED